MLKTLVPCGLVVALLSPLVQAEPDPASIVLAQSQEMSGHGDAASFALGDLVVENPWARESVTRTGVVYFTVRNSGNQDDRLVGVSADVADRAELHSSVMQDGVMKMLPVAAIEVPAEAEAVLAPGGVHVMLVGLAGPLQEGDSFPLTLTFENAGEVQVMTRIEDIGYAGGGSPDHHK